MTPVELSVLDQVRETIARSGVSPPLREIGERHGFSVPRASILLSSLVEQGHLARHPQDRRGRHRHGVVLPDTPNLRAVATADLRAELGRRGVTLDALARPELVNWGRRAVTCAADCCQVEVQRGHLFCWPHWCQIPATLQSDIKLAFGRKDEAEYGRLVTKARDLIDMGQAA